MAVNAKIIRRRVKSVRSTKKITKAMELVAASKMRKAVRAALSTRAYAVLAREMLKKLSLMKKLAVHPLLKARPVKKILLIVLASNRGLCGGFNANVFKKVAEQIKNIEQIAIQRSFGAKILPIHGVKLEIAAIAVGKKSERVLKKLQIPVIASFNELSDATRIEETRVIAKIAREEFLKGSFEKVAIIYTDYISALAQKPTIRQVLPISSIDLEKMVRDLGNHEISAKEKNEYDANVDFLFEPNPELVLEQILPRLTEVQIYQAILESSASEHSSRMMAMRNASEAAEDMIGDLVFTLNQARQANITREIAEISGGVAALE